MDSSTLPRPREPSVLYFAYGSNLHVAQMAQRCPASIFKGTATLSGYRWQINERGVANVVANVVPADDSSVHGLVYLVNPRDVRALDRSEGVARGLYQKHILTVALQPHRQYSEFASARLAEVLAETTSPRQTTDLPLQPGGATVESSQQDSIYRDGAPLGGFLDQRQAQAYRPQDVKALVYVSEGYVTDGSIREEYIARMKKAVADASALGVSQSFLDEFIVPHLKADNSVPAAPEQLEQEKEVENGQKETEEDEKGHKEKRPSEQPDTSNSNTVDEASVQAKQNQEGEREGRYDFVIVGACVLATAGWCSLTLL